MAGVVGEIPRTAAGLKTEVIVVVDGARDATASKAAGAGALVCDVPVNRGQGAALRLGYWLARARGAQVIATIDADGQYEPEEIARVVQPILDGQADFVSGSRRLGAELTTDKVRHLGVLVFGALISVLVRHRVTDPACGIRAMRAEVTAAVKLEQPQYQASELMISAALHGFRLAEVPTTMRDRGEPRHRHQEGRELRLRRAVRARGVAHLDARPEGGADAAAPREDPHLVDREAGHEQHREHGQVGAGDEQHPDAVVGRDALHMALGPGRCLGGDEQRQRPRRSRRRRPPGRMRCGPATRHAQRRLRIQLGIAPAMKATIEHAVVPTPLT